MVAELMIVTALIVSFLFGASVQDSTHFLPGDKLTQTQSTTQAQTQAQAALKELAKNACEKGDHEACEYISQVH